MSYLRSVYTNRRSLAHDMYHLRLDMNRVFDVARGVPPDTEQTIRVTNTQSVKTASKMMSLYPRRLKLYAHAFTLGDVRDRVSAAREFIQFNKWAGDHFAAPEGHGWVFMPMWWPRPKTEIVLLGIVISDDQEKMTPVPLFGYDRV